MAALWKRCTKCGIERPVTEFYVAAGEGATVSVATASSASQKPACSYHEGSQQNRDHVRRWQAENPERYRERQSNYRVAGKKAVADRKSHLKRKYDLTPTEFDAMLAAQSGRCAICRDPPREGSSLHVDHDHDTGRIRGLLCFGCNSALGRFDDDPARLLRAHKYLEEQRRAERLRQGLPEE